MFKTKLPGDYARCCNEDCPSKDKCLRYLDRMNGDVFAVFCAGENEKCEDFIALKLKKKRCAQIALVLHPHLKM